MTGTNNKGLINIGFLQFLPSDDYIHNINYLLKKLSTTRNALIVLPEFFLTGYATNHFLFEDKRLKVYLKELLRLSYINSISLVGSLPISDSGKLCNRCLYINNGEIVGKYDKTMLFGKEKNILNAGKEPIGIFKYKNIKFGVQICLDIIRPFSSSERMKYDIDFLLVPASISVDFLLMIAKARALENQIIVILSNRSMSKKGGCSKDIIKYLGKSTIYYPDGTCVTASAHERTLQMVLITKALLAKIRRKRKLFS